MTEDNIIVKYWGTILVSIFMIISATYVGYNGQDIIVQIFDNLDSNIVWLKMLKDNNLFFKYSEQVPFLHGIDRVYLYSPLKVYVWLYMIFPVFWAFIIGWFLKIIISVYGFIYLGKILKLDENNFNKNIVVFCGFLYGIIPIFPTAAFNFASLPFLLCWLIKYYQKTNNKYNLLFLLYPMFSSFCSFGIFILFYLVMFIFIDAIVNKKIKYYLFYPVVFLMFGYIITEWNLFYIMLLSGEETIRKDIIWLEITNNSSLIFYFIKEAFLYGDIHSSGEHTIILLPFCFLYFFYLIAKKRTQVYKDYYFWIMVLILLNSIFYGLDYYKLFKNIVNAIIPPLKGFQFTRFIWLNPFLWYLAFVVALCRIKSNFRYILDLKFIICLYAFITLLCSENMYNIIKYNFDYQINKHQILGAMQEIEVKNEKDPNKGITYRGFYSENLFNKIKKDINYKGEWSIAYGLHPAILEYNKIKTIDGFLPYYPLKYKYEFRKLIAPRLDIIGKYNYFDHWGVKAYVFSEDYAFSRIRLENNQKESVLLIDVDVFKQLEGKYIFSRFIISNAEELNLKFINVFKDDASPYDIYVYEI